MKFYSINKSKFEYKIVILIDLLQKGIKLST